MKARSILPLLLGIPMLALSHPTPVVKLVEHADAIRQSLKGADRFFLHTVTIGKNDLATIQQAVKFIPDDPDVQFYVGKQGDGTDVGVVLFAQANTVHGPVEVALAMTPDRKIEKVTVTRATVETKPWVQEAIASGFLDHMLDSLARHARFDAVTPLRGKLGAMPYFEAEVIAAAVKKGLVLYGVLYR